MTRNQVRVINHDRLRSWAERLTEQHATPLLLVGMGHDHAIGVTPICTLEAGPSVPELVELRRGAADLLERGEVG